MDESIGTAPGEAVTLAFGFPLADVPDAGPSLIAYAASPDEAERLLERHLSAWNAAEGSFSASAHSPGEAIAKARGLPPGKGPVILADVQDNPGAGGTNDTTGLLAALVDEGLGGALLVHIADKAAADAAFSAGVGARLEMGVGGKADPATGGPVDGPWRVAAVGDGRFVGEGPMYGGNTVDMGPVACLEQNGVRVIVAGQRMQASEPALVRHLGMEPFDVPYLALKSSVHFRGAYQHVAREIIHVAAPGLAPVDLDRLTFCKASRRIAGRTDALG
ncbi:MAG: MlrC C-terminal domain-containing protein, partial [Pseudomonadota bacterium]